MAAQLANSSTERPPSDGAGGGWRAHLKLTVPAFCWEFLRRNPAYAENYRHAVVGDRPLDRRWGLMMPADPALPVDDAGVLWRADVAPGLVVPLEPASFGEPRSLPRAEAAVRTSDEEAHIRLPSGLQLLARGRPALGPWVVVLSYDADFSLRVRACEALRRAEITDAPPRSRLSLAQRERLARALYALDASLRRASYRQIAADIFGLPDDEMDFKTSSVRDVTIRLVRRGRALMAGGYLKLLRGGF